MNRYDSSHKLKKTAEGRKAPHSSMHHTTLRISENLFHQKQKHKILPALNYKERNIPIYLLYKGFKFVIKSYYGMPFKDLVQLLYKQIVSFEFKKNSSKNKCDAQKIIRQVLGFSTICNNLKTDYLISIMHGEVQKSLLLECFIKKKTKIKNIPENLNNQNFTTKRSQNQNNFSFNYEIYNCLAIGGFSKVYLARSYDDGKFYAIKFIKKRKEQEKEKQDFCRSTVINQMEICAELDHPFLIKMREGFQTSNFFCMVFQYCPGGQLFFLLKKIRTMSEENARLYFIQILLGIKYVHDKNILYRDLKPQNILIDSQGNLKIVDFGLSKKVNSCRQKTFSYCGSAQYMAPEMILRSGHNSAIDYYSLGALLFQLVTGLPPFYSKNQQQLQESIVTQQLCFPNHIQLSEEIKDFLSHLLAKDQRVRLGSYAGIKQIMIHPWVGKFNSQLYLNKKDYKIPYPPNLSQYNFDTEQLGDDQEEFSNEIYKQFGFNMATNDIKFYIQAKHEQKLNYQPIISKLLQQIPFQRLQQKQISEKKAKSNDLQLAKIYKCQKIVKRFRHVNKTLNQKPRSQQLQASMNNGITVSLTKCTGSLWRKKLKQQSFNSEKSYEQKQNKEIKQRIQVKGQKQKKNYTKLLPYFCKNKPYKFSENENRKLPRANILRLKVSVNELKQQILPSNN